jgi:hypothetical protein
MALILVPPLFVSHFSHAYETVAGHAVFLQTPSHLSFHFLFPR